MKLHPNKTTIVASELLVLHNMLRVISRESHTPEGCIDFENDSGEITFGAWRDEGLGLLRDLRASQCKRASSSGEEIRRTFAEHFWGPGQIPWQWKYV